MGKLQDNQTPKKKNKPKKVPKAVHISELGELLKRMKTLVGTATIAEMNAKAWPNRDEVQQGVRDALATLNLHGSGTIGKAIRVAQDDRLKALELKDKCPAYATVYAKFVKISIADRVDDLENLAWSKIENFPEAYKEIAMGLKTLVHAHKGCASGYKLTIGDTSYGMADIIGAFMLDKATSAAGIRKAK
jgi:hypothetical protein